MAEIKLTASPFIDGSIVGVDIAELASMPDPMRDAARTITRWKIDTADAGIRGGLIALGWLPPATERTGMAEVARFGDMDERGERVALRAGREPDGDMYLAITTGGSVQFCTIGSGGGKSPRVHEALKHLMLAIEADNKADPSRDWWASRGVNVR